MSGKPWFVGRTLLAVVIASAGSGACSSTPAEQPQARADAAIVAPAALEEATARVFDEVETHADQPPHGGVIVPLGAHAAHAEVVAVPDAGELTLYVLDGEGRPGQRIAQPTVVLDVETSGRFLRLEMSAAPDEGVGERVGDASRFVVRSDDLLRMGDARVTIKWLGVNGQVFGDVVVDWPPPAT